MKRLLSPTQIDTLIIAMSISMFAAIVRVMFSKDTGFKDLVRLFIGSGLLGGVVGALAHEFNALVPYYKVIAGFIGFTGDKFHKLLIENLFTALYKIMDSMPKLIMEGIKNTVSFFKTEKKEEDEPVNSGNN